jgi:hypothetical protein
LVEELPEVLREDEETDELLFEERELLPLYGLVEELPEELRTVALGVVLRFEPEEPRTEEPYPPLVCDEAFRLIVAAPPLYVLRSLTPPFRL